VEKGFPQANGLLKQAGVAILISDKVDFRLNSVRRDNEGHYILIKGTIHQEEISILNIYTPNTGIPICIKQTKNSNRPNTHCVIDPNTMIVRDLNNPCHQEIVIQAKDQQRNFRAFAHIRPNGHNRHL
jgi:hypothetical protein